MAARTTWSVFMPLPPSRGGEELVHPPVTYRPVDAVPVLVPLTLPEVVRLWDTRVIAPIGLFTGHYALQLRLGVPCVAVARKCVASPGLPPTEDPQQPSSEST